MPFVTFYLSKGDKKIAYDMRIEYPASVSKKIVLEGYHLDKIIPDENKHLQEANP